MASKAKKRHPAADRAIEMLKDAIRDIEIISDGRGHESRYHTVLMSLYEVQDVIKVFDPYRRKNQDVDVIEHKKPLALEHKPSLFS